MGNEFWAALIGAIVGGGFTFAAQMYANYRQKEEIDKKEMDQVRSNLTSVIIKSIRVYNQFLKISEYIDDCMRHPEFENTPNPCFYVLTIINIPSSIEFTDSEATSIRFFDDDEILNGLLDLPYLHASLISQLQEYNKIRQLLENIETVAASGTISISSIPFHEIKTWEPKIAYGNRLIFGIKKMCDDEMKIYDEVIGRAVKIAREKYNSKLKTDFKGDDDTLHWTKRLR
jgi:hypothetical protein